jgi:hypothetical protein
LVVTQTPEDWQQITAPVSPALVPGNGLQALPVNGWIYRFNEKGQLQWLNKVFNQMLLVDRSGQAPVVLFAAYVTRNIVQGAERRPTRVTEVKALDRRTGKLLLDVENTMQQPPFHALTLDPGQGRIELTSSQMRYVFTVVAEK